MSKTNNRFIKKVLSKNIQLISINGENVKVTTVFWCNVDSETSTTIRSSYFGKNVYFSGKSSESNSIKRYGIDVRSISKSVSLKKKNLEKSLIDLDTKKQLGFINTRRSKAVSESFRSYMMSSGLHSKNLKGTVLYFDKLLGTGLVQVGEYKYDVYACNFKGAKTGFETTACVYLVKNEIIDCNLCELSNHLSLNVTSGVHFDKEKWDSLDHSNLAFVRNDDGTFKNGLFA